MPTEKNIEETRLNKIMESQIPGCHGKMDIITNCEMYIEFSCKKCSNSVKRMKYLDVFNKDAHEQNMQALDNYFKED